MVKMMRNLRVYRPKSSLLALFIIVGVAGLGFLGDLLAASALRVGFGEVGITPPPGTPMAGYYHERASSGVLDGLFSKAMVIEVGDARICLVSLDLISTTSALTLSARQQIERLTGIPASNVLVSATHAHTGPELANRENRSAGLGDSSEATLRYSSSLPELIAESVRIAQVRATNANVSVAGGICEGLAFNRRFYMRDGSVGWNPGKRNAGVSAAAGGTDPSVEVVLAEPSGIERSFAHSLGMYVGFAMHPDTVGGTGLSADYPGALARRMREYHGADCITLFGNGTCGNLNHIDVSWSRIQQGVEEANRVGTVLAAAVFLAEKQLQPITKFEIGAISKKVLLPVPELSEAEIASARVTVRSTHDDRGTNFLRLVQAYKVLDVAAREGKPWEVEVQVLYLGDEVAWVSLPGEIFVELGLAIKRRSPFRHTIPVELANGSIGYIPDRRSYLEGNYEPISARCAPGSGEILVEAVVELLGTAHRRVHSSAVPEQ
jgi:neutral ceramidase